MQPSFCRTVRRVRVVVLVGCSVLMMAAAAGAQEAPDTQSVGPLMPAKPQAAEPNAAQAPAEQAPAEAMPTNLGPVPVFDKSIFQDPLPSAQLAFLKSFDGAQTKDLYRDKQFKAVKKAALPKWEFHYGHDMSVSDAMDTALDDSREAVQVRDGRYVMLSGTSGLFPGLQGRGFLWIDMQDGLLLGGFYFRPTNGEPAPSMTVFSKQLEVDAISMSQLPPEFFRDFSQWSAEERIPPVTTRYFIGGLQQRILLEHDEDFCTTAVGPMGSDCLQMTADAADVDMNAAYYLDQVHYATNGTAWMIVGSDERDFIRLRDNRCGSVVDPLGCRIRITREQVHRISRPAPAPRPRPR